MRMLKNSLAELVKEILELLFVEDSEDDMHRSFLTIYALGIFYGYFTEVELELYDWVLILYFLIKIIN